MSEWFADCPNLLDVDCEGWNSAHVNDMSGLFKNCPKLTKVDNLTQLNMTGTANCSSMFEGCSQLESVTIFDPDWSDNPVKPTNVSRMFKDCAKLWEVDLGNMSIGADAEAPNMEEMFSGCNNLTAISFNSDSLYFTNDIFDADDDFLKIDGVWVYQSAQDASITLHHSLPRAEDDGEVSGRYKLIKRTPLKTLGLSFASPRAGEKLPKEGNIMVEALFYMQGSDNADKAQKFYVPTGLTWKPTPADPDETADYETEYTASVPWTSVIGEFVVDENTPIEYENPEGTQGSGPIRIWRDGGTLNATFKTNSKPTAPSGIKFDPSDLRKVYTGDPVTLKPTITRGQGNSLEGDEERMSYEHRAAGAEPSEEWTAGLPTNAGSYEVRATLAPAEDDEHEYSGAQVVVELVVDKADYQVGDPAIDYQDELIVLTGEDAGSVEATADGVSLEVAAGTGSATVSLTEALDAPAWSAPGEEHAVALSIRGDDNHNGYAKEIRVPSRPSVELRVASQPSEPGQQGVIAGFDPAAAAAGLYEMAATSGQAPARGAASWGPAPLTQDAEGAWVAQLDPGTYAFRLKASDESGSFASLESAPLTVTAPSGIKFDPSDLRKVYTGDPVTLKPTITRGQGNSLEGDEERMSYEHRAAGAEPSEEWTAGLPTNAGSYEVRATLAPAEDDEHEYSGAQVVVELVVDKADYQVGDPAIDYQDELIVLTGEDAGSVEATADGVSLEVAAGTGSATVSLTEALDAPAWSAPGEEHAVALSIRGDDNHNGYAKEIRVPSRPSVELRVASQPSEPGQQGVIAGFDPAAAAAGLYEMAATSGQAPARGAASWGPAPLTQDAEGAWVAQLDPGTYAFRLKASDESGSFASLESAPLTVTAPSGITPPATDSQPQQPQPLPQQPNDTQALPSAGDTATAAAMSALASGAVVALSVAAATRRSKR
ncbi:BspA family leucine-rich repeat surface protein [Gordonibacter sp. An230]|uniref:BspA family leucine-rich repeat surface protein n=1 Tax=Gordonibacter sp. An230 TaxID=1965592 RepID=UPI0013A64DCF|nr:BspA family leucine-rich repeat surface protein [Gordonibacter sp. An230]